MQLEGKFTYDAVGIVMTQLGVEMVRTAGAQFCIGVKVSLSGRSTGFEV